MGKYNNRFRIDRKGGGDKFIEFISDKYGADVYVFSNESTQDAEDIVHLKNTSSFLDMLEVLGINVKSASEGSSKKVR